MSTGWEILIGAGGTVAALLTVLLPVIRAQGSSLRREMDTLRGDLRANADTLRADLRGDLNTLRGDLRGDVASLRADMNEMRRDLRDLGERVSRLEPPPTGPPAAPASARGETSGSVVEGRPVARQVRPAAAGA